MAEESKADNNAVSIQKLENSALGSWSGYIYQGLCGVLVVLRMLVEDREQYIDYAIQLDGYEDFSIMDKNGKIVSLHQCKSVKNRVSYEDEFVKMKMKRESLRSQLQNPDNTKCFFHCNNAVNIKKEYKIEPYPFQVGKTTCEPGEIKGLITEEIKRIVGPDTDYDTVYARLDSMVNKRVLDIQQSSFLSKKPLKEIARDFSQSISFNRFNSILCSIHFTLARDEVLECMRSEYITGLQQKIDEDNRHDTSGVESFLDRFCELNPDELWKFLQRINPKEKIDTTLNCFKTFTHSSRINLLYRLLLDIPLPNSKLHWETSKTLQTPSTLGNDEDEWEISRKIYQNRANLDMVWVYDWFVGRLDSSIEDIRESAGVFNEIDHSDEDKNNIFKTKRIGVLTIQDKKSGAFD